MPSDVPAAFPAGRLVRANTHKAVLYRILSDDSDTFIALPSQPISADDDTPLAPGSTVSLPCGYVASSMTCAYIGKGKKLGVSRAPVK